MEVLSFVSAVTFVVVLFEVSVCGTGAEILLFSCKKQWQEVIEFLKTVMLFSS
jgi:hypothetical protein